MKPAKIRLEVKRADGSPAAGVELAVSIVDRAVYAVQAEFRPGVFDFFYPLQRNNLASFYSDELQGYGYADLLRKPNFALSALKSQSKLAKKAMRDTAGWFPHVVTDANGMASVDADMPANITEWLVTAVGGDKQGRLGENTGQFRTVSRCGLGTGRAAIFADRRRSGSHDTFKQSLAPDGQCRRQYRLAGGAGIANRRIDPEYLLGRQPGRAVAAAPKRRRTVRPCCPEVGFVRRGFGSGWRRRGIRPADQGRRLPATADQRLAGQSAADGITGPSRRRCGWTFASIPAYSAPPCKRRRCWCNIPMAAPNNWRMASPRIWC